MQVQANWRAAANLNLLLGNEHPPTRIEKSMQLPSTPHPGSAVIEARNTANFRTTAYCGLQDSEAPRNQRTLTAHYSSLLQRVQLWNHPLGSVKKDDGEEEACDKIKDECEDSEEAIRSPGAAVDSADEMSQCTFRALGILTQVHDPTAIGEELLVPWEFYVIQDIHDEACYEAPLRALTKETSLDSFPLLNAQIMLGEYDGAGVTTASAAAAAASSAAVARQHHLNPMADDHAGAASRYADGTRISLYTRLLPKFTGVYPGMALGVIGEPFQRSAQGVLIGVLVRQLVFPARPLFPWRVDRPLRRLPSHSSAETPALVVPTRVHLCSGPFPRRDIAALLRAVTVQALHRGADLLVIGGPLVKPFEDFEKTLLPTLGVTYSEMLESFVDTLEDTLTSYYATRLNIAHMKVVLVPHRDDVTQVPVLPTTMYALADTKDVLVRSNPCRISVNGIHIGVCNEDVVGTMREHMVERWPTAEGSLRRVVEALVQGRMYTPIIGLPLTHVDVNHLLTLRMEYAPEVNELLAIQENASDSDADGHRAAALLSAANWSSLFMVDDTADEGDLKQERKRPKREEPSAYGGSSHSEQRKGGQPAMEYMPHIMFLPSTRPQFAMITHRGVLEDTHNGYIRDESSLDDLDAATGVLVVNQEVWSHRKSPKFELRVMEVTASNSELVAMRGASAAHGVACGVLHVFDGGR